MMKLLHTFEGYIVFSKKVSEIPRDFFKYGPNWTLIKVIIMQIFTLLSN